MQIFEVQTRTVHSSDAAFAFYMIDLALRMERIVLELLDFKEEDDLSESTRRILSDAKRCFDLYLRSDEKAMKLIKNWIVEAEAEICTDGKRTSNIPTLCVLHSYKALMQGNAKNGLSDAKKGLSAEQLVDILGSVAFVR